MYLVASAHVRHCDSLPLVIVTETPSRFLRLRKQFIGLFVELYIFMPGFCCYTNVSLNSYSALSQRFTHYLADCPLNLFSPPSSRYHNLPLAVVRVPHKDRVVGRALVDHSLLEGLDYILVKVLLDAKN